MEEALTDGSLGEMLDTCVLRFCVKELVREAGHVCFSLPLNYVE